MMIFRMMATMATLGGLPAAMKAPYLAFISALKTLWGGRQG